MKNRLAILVAGTMVVCSLAACGVTTSTPIDNTTAENNTITEATTENFTDDDWYQVVLRDQATKDQYSFHQLKDINGDDVSELFLSTTEADFIGDEDKACIMAYVDGEAKTLMEIGGNAGEKFFVNENQHTLVHYSRGSGESHLEIFTLDEGELTPAETADYYAGYHDPNEEAAEKHYYFNGEKVSEDILNSFYELNADDSMVITYVAIP